MPIVVLHFPTIEEPSQGRKRRCPYCEGDMLQSWGKVSKLVRDSHHQKIILHRFRCCQCGHTFRDYPQGVDHSFLSTRMQNLAALTFALGLSVKQVGEAFASLGLSLSDMTIYRHGREMVTRLDPSGRRKYEFVYLMQNCPTPSECPPTGVVLQINLGPGETIVLNILDEYNPRIVQRWLEPVCREMGVEISLLEPDHLAS
jgi:hypothetical protein